MYPEHRECATVFFSDIVGFTVISSSLAPEKISDMLHRCGESEREGGREGERERERES